MGGCLCYTKPMNIGIGIPTPERVHPDFSISCLPQIVSYTKKHLPDVNLFIRPQGGVRTDRNRNAILKDFIDKGDIDYILWLDADMVYPHDIIKRYLELKKLHGEMSVIGCLYFKRSSPHSPIGYVDSGKDDKPFRPLMPQMVKKGKIYEVTGVGYGGMMVPMEVYDKLGDEKWTHYGVNFHIPDAEDGNLTHDLEFCRTVKKHGFKIFLHGSVRPGHIAEKLITEEDFYDNFPPRLLKGLKVMVAIPATDEKLATKAAKVMGKRAGYDCDIRVILDKNKKGYTHVINSAYMVNNKKYDFFVYTAQDVFVGSNWLAEALKEQFKSQAGLISFNDGKWNGQLASFGLVETLWANKNYGGNLFYPEYKSHYGDTELTQIAKHDKNFSYAKDAVMLEVDYKKAIGKGHVNKDDKKLYKQRIKDLVSDELAKQFK